MRPGHPHGHNLMAFGDLTFITINVSYCIFEVYCKDIFVYFSGLIKKIGSHGPELFWHLISKEYTT